MCDNYCSLFVLLALAFGGIQKGQKRVIDRGVGGRTRKGTTLYPLVLAIFFDISSQQGGQAYIFVLS